MNPDASNEFWILLIAVFIGAPLLYWAVQSEKRRVRASLRAKGYSEEESQRIAEAIAGSRDALRLEASVPDRRHEVQLLERLEALEARLNAREQALEKRDRALEKRERELEERELDGR